LKVRIKNFRKKFKTKMIFMDLKSWMTICLTILKETFLLALRIRICQKFPSFLRRYLRKKLLVQYVSRILKAQPLRHHVDTISIKMRSKNGFNIPENALSAEKSASEYLIIYYF